MDSLPNRNAPKPNRVIRTRNRVPRSCAGCRSRKLKCNREKPACQNCIARDEASTCTYEGSGAGSGVQSQSHGRVHESPGPSSTTMRSRIDRLESLILSMVSEDQGSGHQRPSSNASGDGENHSLTPVENGTLPTKNKYSGNIGISGNSYENPEIPRKAIEFTSIYSQNTHWDTILQDIATIKDIWIQDYEAQDANIKKPDLPVKHRPGILEGLNPSPSIAEILSSLPPKAGADKLIARLYDAYNPQVPTKMIFHRQTFLKQYQRYWNDPSSKPPPGWLALLFAVFGFTIQSYTNGTEPPDFQGRVQELSELYRIRTVQCLRIADITKPSEYVLQALIFYNLTDYSRSKDSKLGIWLMNGMIIRLAVQQELHRDPSHDRSITPFKGEMRRRLWSTIWDGDLLFSHQVGSPRMFHHNDSDTQSPSNLHEEELYEEMKELPPSRPLTEPTQVAYYVCKIKLVRVFGEITEHIHSLLPNQPYSDVLDLHHRLNAVHQEIAPHLKMRPITQMIGETPSLIMERFILENLFHKSTCILHRNHLSPSYTDSSLIFSRNACVQSAVKLLKSQATLHQESHKEGLMSSMAWWSISTHDFLMAAMILCVDLVHQLQKHSGSNTPPNNERQQHIQALETARSIWLEVMDKSTDARKAVCILTQMISKIKNAQYEYHGVGVVENSGQGCYRSVLESSDVGDSSSMPTVMSTNDIGISTPADSPPVPMQLDSNSNNLSQFATTNLPSHTISSATDTNNIDPMAFTSYGYTWPAGFDSGALDWAAWDEFVRNDTHEREQNGNTDLGFGDFVL